MKLHHLILSAIALAIAAACTPATTLNWEEGVTDPETGRATHTLTISNAPDGPWRLWFSSLYRMRGLTVEEGSQATIEFHGGSLYSIVPSEDHGSEMVIRYTTAPLSKHCWSPEGFTLDYNGTLTSLDVSCTYQPCEDGVPFDYNPVTTAATDMIPRVKSAIAGEGTTEVKDGTWKELMEQYPAEIVSGKPAGWYKLVVNDGVSVQAADEDGAFYAAVTLKNIILAGGTTVANVTVEDAPCLQYRGMMLDISRNFTTKDNLLTLIDLLAHYKVNFLHLHFGDDEGWRIEMDGLPELTEYGAFHAIPTINEDGSISEPDGLMPSHNGPLGTSGDGYYSHEDFVEILKYAWERRIRVVPEFDTPGHSRAAIKSMEARYARTGDATYLLSEPEDKSVYESVQYFKDNAVNVALESTYAFVAKVFDNFIAMYKEAGAPLYSLHFGGDEVPGGAWTDSPSCKALMASKGWTEINMLKDYYISRVIDIAEERGVCISGWQEVTRNITPETAARLKNVLSHSNVWSVSGARVELPYQVANEGFKVVVSNSPNTYADMAYSSAKNERGHTWTGVIDERRSFCLLPFDSYKSIRWDDNGAMVDLSKVNEGREPLVLKDNIIGVQGQLWTETIRTFDHVTYYIFPKMLGVFERGWNASPVWESSTVADDPAFMADFDKFYSIIVDHEMPYYDSIGVAYHGR